MRSLELLAPAKNLECGIAAIDHGADAVYIGAPKHGARAAVGNSIDDIRTLCDYAHQFYVKIYVTVNTIIYDDELADTCQMMSELKSAGVDALLVQDMGLVSLSPLPLHASTQTDNRSADKVRWLKSLGFMRVVLARELSISEIRAIHESVPDIELEVFVHGALCVSYSGLCYASQYCFGRSANRGECAQFCRMKFSLEDAAGEQIGPECHYLSLRDLNQSERIAELIEAGASSFKIEGRLKDVAYVKNVTATYSRLLDEYISRHSKDYCRASAGRVEYNFTPNLNKTFNRGYTNYFSGCSRDARGFLNGRSTDIAGFDSPKSRGEYVGEVKELHGRSFSVRGTASFANGDGLCFVNSRHELEGFRVNKAEGNRLFPLQMPSELRPGMALYRNNDIEFEKILARSDSAVRRLGVSLRFMPVIDGYRLEMTVHLAQLSAPLVVFAEASFAHEEASMPQRDNIIRQLSKFGGTIYECLSVDVPADFRFFVPNSILASLRRDVVSRAAAALRQSAAAASVKESSQYGITETLPEYRVPYLYNIANSKAREFYVEHGLAAPQPALEVQQLQGEKLLMQCRHCLRFSLGYCFVNGGRRPSWHEPLYLRLGDGRRFRLGFDCKQCQMNVYADS